MGSMVLVKPSWPLNLRRGGHYFKHIQVAKVVPRALSRDCYDVGALCLDCSGIIMGHM